VASAAAVMAALERRVEQIVAELAVNITAELIEATPVDTGWARANWIPSLRRPEPGTTGSREAPSSAAQTSGLAEVLRFTLEDGVAYVTNHVPYLRALDAGHSSQAPSGFIRLAVARAIVLAGHGDQLVQPLGGQAAANLASAYAPEGLGL
jgi:hypothetical protein